MSYPPKLEEIAIKIDAHGKAAIENILTVGKLLCEAREVLPANNEFGEWRESRIPWLSQKMAYNWMNVYRNNGETLVGNNFRPTVLYELTAPEVPDSAREEAMEHESLTVKQSKELVQAHKDFSHAGLLNASEKMPLSMVFASMRAYPGRWWWC